MVKILSGVAGGAAGIQGGAGAGFNTTRGLLDSKYDRAIEDYDRSGQNLGLMAQIEGSNQDRDTQLAIQMADQERADRDESLKVADFLRKQGYTQAQIDNLVSIGKHRGSDTYEDINTGVTKRRFNDGTERVVGQTGRTPEDIAADEAFNRANRLSDSKELSLFNSDLRTNQPGRSLSPSQEDKAKENATIELIEDNPYFREMLDDNGFRAENVSDADWSVFEQERNKIITRQGGLVDTIGSRAGDVHLPLQSQQSTPDGPPPIPLNPGNPSGNVSMSNNRESDIDNAIRERYPEVTEEELRDPDFRRRVAEFMGIN